MFRSLHDLTKPDGLTETLSGQQWYLNGFLHREDGPAFCLPQCEEWYFEGYLHRIGAPALTRFGDRYWMVKGKIHREDGPAIMFKHESKHNRWFINDIDITVEVKQWLKENGFRYPLNVSEKVLFKLRFC
jgi:hypothetical protein